MGIRIPEWKAVERVPNLPAFWRPYSADKGIIEDIILVPYGCNTLRISQFPTYDAY